MSQTEWERKNPTLTRNAKAGLGTDVNGNRRKTNNAERSVAWFFEDWPKASPLIADAGRRYSISGRVLKEGWQQNNSNRK